MKRKILLVGNVYGSYRSQNLVKVLLDAGHLVAFSSPSFFISSSGCRTCLGLLVRKVGNAIARVLFVCDFLFKSVFADVVYLMAMNYRYAIVAYLVKLVTRRPLVVDLYVSAYDTGRDRGWFAAEGSPRARYYKFLDKLLIEKSDILIHVSEVEIEYIAKLVDAQIRREGLRIIPLGVDSRALACPDGSDPFRICWWGRFIPLHGLDNIIYAARKLVDDRINVRFDLFGLPGVDSHEYETKIRDLGLGETVHLHTTMSFGNGELEPFLRRNCDLALGNFGNSEKAKIVVVNKLVDAFAMGLPVLTMDNIGLGEFIDKERDCFVCDNDPESIAGAITRIMGDPAERRLRGRAGHRRYLEVFSVDRYARRVLAAVEAACDRTGC